MKLTDKIAITANSTALYLLSYLFVFVLHQAFTLLAAWIFKYSVEFNFTDITFLVYKYAWTFDSVKIIYSAGPIFCLLLSIFMIVVAIRFREFDGFLKVFFLWGFVHSINFFLGSAIAGALLGEGFGHVLTWMYIPDTGKLIFTLIGLFGLAAIGFAITKLFLLSANSYYNMQEVSDRPGFILHQALLPYIFGTVVIIAMRLPLGYYELLRILTPLIVILPLFINSKGFPITYFDENPRTIKISSSLIAAAIVILAVYRIGLSFPLRF